MSAENEIIEYKESLTQLKKAVISICAILNKHKKGKIIFGIKNNDSVVGITIGKDTLRTVSKTISDYIEPKIYPKIFEEVINNKKCVSIEFSGFQVPYFAYGRAYIKIADEDKVMTSKELEKYILLKNKDKLFWDKSICKNTKLNAISSEKLKIYTFLANIKYISKINTLKNLDLVNCENKLTNASIILFSKNPNKFFNLLNLRCITFLENSVDSKIIDMTDFNGDLLELIKSAENYIIQHTNVSMILKGLVRKDIYEINKDAFREAIINAFCHRDYSIPQEINIYIFKDRVEIRNPGNLYDNISLEDILTKKISKRRNPLIADILQRIHFVEKWGTGISKIQKLESKTKFEVFSNFFSVVFPRKVGTINEPLNEGLNEGVNKGVNLLLQTITENPGLRTNRYSEILKTSPKNIERWIKKLKSQNLVEFKGSSKTGGYFIKKERL